METFALFYIAKKLQKEAGAILTVSDNLLTGEKLTTTQREENLSRAIKIVLESL